MKAKLLLIAVAAALTVSCSKSGSPSGDNAAATPVAPVVPYTPPSTGPGDNPGGIGATFIYGGSTPFAFTDIATYRDYTDRYVTSLTEVVDPYINLNLLRYDNTLGSSFGGTVTIRYKYQSTVYEGFFTSGHDATSTQYNIWFNYVGNNTWHGFFEDFMGAIIVVLNGPPVASPLPATLNGTVWFRNFQATTNSHPNHYCWFQIGGAYDCRAWNTATGVNTTAADIPSTLDGWQKLGTFQNINLDRAFNSELP